MENCSPLLSAAVANLHSKILDAPRPLGVQILSISCSFGENLAKSYVGGLPGGLAPPSRGNPGSATELPLIILLSKIVNRITPANRLYEDAKMTLEVLRNCRLIY